MICVNGHALIRVYIGGRWFLQCVNSGCTYLIPE